MDKTKTHLRQTTLQFVYAFATLIFCFGFTTSTAKSQETRQTVSVKFVNSKDQPISGVKAYWFKDGKAKRLSTTDGIGEIPEPAGLVVAKKDGHQFSGALLSSGQSSTKVVMLTVDEPGKKFKTLPFPISEKDKKETIEKSKTHFGHPWKQSPRTWETYPSTSACWHGFRLTKRLTLLKRISKADKREE